MMTVVKEKKKRKKEIGKVVDSHTLRRHQHAVRRGHVAAKRLGRRHGYSTHRQHNILEKHGCFFLLGGLYLQLRTARTSMMMLEIDLSHMYVWHPQCDCFCLTHHKGLQKIVIAFSSAVFLRSTYSATTLARQM